MIFTGKNSVIITSSNMMINCMEDRLNYNTMQILKTYHMIEDSDYMVNLYLDKYSSSMLDEIYNDG